MLFFNLIFYFPIWCTDPPKIVDFQPEYMVGVQQSVTLKCEAEGNPPPTQTWTPCNDPEQVCDKNTLDISQVLNDNNYTYRVANVYGNDSKTANVCKSNVHCSHGSNTCRLHVCTNMAFWLGSQSWTRGLSLSGCKSPYSALILCLDG